MEKIWSIIIDVIAIVAEIFTIDENELMEQIIRDNRRFKKTVKRFVFYVATILMYIGYVPTYTTVA